MRKFKIGQLVKTGFSEPERYRFCPAYVIITALPKAEASSLYTAKVIYTTQRRYKQDEGMELSFFERELRPFTGKIPLKVTLALL